jgi:hypothetical protein
MNLSISSLLDQLNLIENYIQDFEKKNSKISKATVGWQLDHSLKVINSVVFGMKNSDPSLYKNNFKFLGKVLLGINYFPRGKAKAPKHVNPPEIILKEAIFAQLTTARENIKAIQSLDENAFFKHPLFGNVNKNRVLSFLNAHTNHHLKIVRSILK